MPTPYSPLAIANTFLELHACQDGIEHMKLQKLVYCSHGWWLAVYEDGHMLLDERPQVWKHGPVFESLYRALRTFGRAPIYDAQSAGPFDAPPLVDKDDENVRQLINWVWGRYGHLTSFALSDLTHKAGTPWSRVASEHNYRVPFNLEIPDEYIRQEFQAIMQRDRSSAAPAEPLRGEENEHREHRVG